MNRVTYFFPPDASPARYVKRCKYKPLGGNFCFTLLGGSTHRLKLDEFCDTALLRVGKSPEALRIHLCWFRICEYINLRSRLTLCKWSLQCFYSKAATNSKLDYWDDHRANGNWLVKSIWGLVAELLFHFVSFFTFTLILLFLYYCFYFYIGPILTTTATMLKGNLAK